MSMSIAAVSESQTLTNLQAAYAGECNVAIEYTAFAIRAEIDGYLRVADLFRAAVRAEQVHAAHHAQIITKLGGTPCAVIHSPEVKSTRENLEVAKAGEEYERDVMYVEFIMEATPANGYADAVRSFTLASMAEKVHAQLFSQALLNLEAWHVQTTFYVCLICGDITANLEEKKCCPICDAPKEKFTTVR
jgi:rubrerythrin